MMINELIELGKKAKEEGKNILEEFNTMKKDLYEYDLTKITEVYSRLNTYNMNVQSRFNNRIKRMIYDECEIEIIKHVDFICIDVKLNNSRFRFHIAPSKEEVSIEPMSMALITQRSNDGADYKILKLMARLLDNEDMLVDYGKWLFDESFDICDRLGRMIKLIKDYKELVDKERAKEGK